MDGFAWMIKNGLQAAGVKIDPAEIERTIETAKVLIPRIAQDFQRLEESQKRIEAKLDAFIAALVLTDPQAVFTSAQANIAETDRFNDA